MKVIYHCFGGSHSSVTVAALHLGLLPQDRLPTSQELMAIPYYDKTNDEDFGSIHYMGRDEKGNEIYILGKKRLGNRFSHVLEGIAEMLGKENEILTVNVLTKVNISMKLGGFTSRRIRMPFPGRSLVIRGTQHAFASLVNLAEVTKIRILNR
ncbi:MAG TPA: DUF3189 family protein [Syntrophomonas sp.]|nr:DUF3189 family protein [Syntrophomonas sp.]